MTASDAGKEEIFISAVSQLTAGSQTSLQSCRQAPRRLATGKATHAKRLLYASVACWDSGEALMTYRQISNCKSDTLPCTLKLSMETMYKDTLSAPCRVCHLQRVSARHRVSGPLKGSWNPDVGIIVWHSTSQFEVDTLLAPHYTFSRWRNVSSYPTIASIIQVALRPTSLLGDCR